MSRLNIFNYLLSKRNQLEVNSGEELADMLEDPPIIREPDSKTPATPSTPCIPSNPITEKKYKQKRSCVLS